MDLTRDQYLRYSRQLMLRQVQLAGQGKLLEAKVLLVGMGGLGSPIALYLAGAGVGTLGLADGDRVDLSNLQRQVIHGTADLDTFKVDSAERKINALNPDVKVIKHQAWLNSENAMGIVSRYDLVIDGTDNFPMRYLLNDACAILKKPLVYGAVFQFEGQTTVFDPARGGPCYRCLFPVPPAPGEVPSCGEAGVIGVVPGIIGLLQASEAIKIILGKGRTLTGRLMLCDTLGATVREFVINPDPACPMCGKNRTITELQDYEAFCGLRQQRELEVEGDTATASRITVVDLDKKLKAGEKPVFVDVREEWEHGIYPFPEGIQIPYSTFARRLLSVRVPQPRCRPGAAADGLPERPEPRGRPRVLVPASRRVRRQRIVSAVFSSDS
jgi:adenylyltransferase/sulfurtransferase